MKQSGQTGFGNWLRRLLGIASTPASPGRETQEPENGCCPSPCCGSGAPCTVDSQPTSQPPAAEPAPAEVTATDPAPSDPAPAPTAVAPAPPQQLRAETEHTSIGTGNVQADYLSGMVCLLKGECDQAVAVFSEIIRVAPDHASAYGGRANAYLTKGEKTKAEEDFATSRQLRGL